MSIGWYPGWRVTLAWLFTVALAGLIYFLPVTRLVDSLNDHPLQSRPPNSRDAGKAAQRPPARPLALLADHCGDRRRLAAWRNVAVFAPTMVASPSLNLRCAQLGEGHFLNLTMVRSLLTLVDRVAG